MLRMSLLMGFAVMLATSPAAGEPILAEFSRTANSIVDDGIGPAPPLSQVVNNFDRSGLVLTLLTDGSLADSNFAQAFTFVSFGVVRVLAVATSRDGIQKSATADGGLQDVLMIGGTGTTGTTYRFTGSLAVSGRTSYPIGDPGALSVINAAWHWNAFQNNLPIGGAAQNFTRNSTGLDEEGVDFLGTSIPVVFDFVWGEPIILEMGLGGGVGANSGNPGNFASAAVDMSNSLVWQGASIVTLDGVPLDAFIESQSGADWNEAARVPEPATAVLFALAVGLAARHRRSISRRA